MYSEITFIGGPMDDQVVAINHDPQPVMSVAVSDGDFNSDDPNANVLVTVVNHEYVYSNLNENGLHVYSYTGTAE